MEKALKIGKMSVTGSFHLFVGKVVSTIVLAAGSIALGRLISPEQYGLYSISLIPVLMVTLFRDWGIGLAMAKNIAYFRAINKDKCIKDVIVAGLVFKLAVGLILTFLTILFSNSIASAIFHRPQLAPLIAIAALAIFAGSLFTASQSIFLGFEKMKLRSLTMVCQAIVQGLLVPLLVFFGYGALGAVVGYALSYLISGILGTALTFFLIFRKINTIKKGKGFRIIENLKIMLHYGVPLSISTILDGLGTYFYGFMMAIFCNDVMIGNYQIAIQFSTILTFFTVPISTVLFPAFSKIDLQEENELLQTIFTSSIKYTSLILVPTTVVVMILSKPMVSALFGEKWIQAPFFLTLYVIDNLFIIFGNVILGSLLAGIGETRMRMKISLITLAVGVPLSLILVPKMKIIGLIFTIILASKPSLAIGLYWTKKKHNVKLGMKSSVKILLTSIVSSIITFSVLKFVWSSYWIKLIVGIPIFSLAYLLITPILGVVDKNDIQNLKIMFSGLGVISKIINIPLKFVEKVSNLI